MRDTRDERITQLYEKALAAILCKKITELRTKFEVTDSD